MTILVAAEIGEEKIQEGVYQCQVGPCYETVAEQKLALAGGVDALGMSTVYEGKTAFISKTIYSRLKLLLLAIVKSSALQFP